LTDNNFKCTHLDKVAYGDHAVYSVGNLLKDLYANDFRLQRRKNDYNRFTFHRVTAKVTYT